MNGRYKVAIELLDLSTGERRCLAQRTGLPAAQAQLGEDRVPGIVTGSWRFDPATIAWGNSVLERTKVTELVIIDEIGPLEFEQGKGLQAALRLLDASRYRLACVTLRPSLVVTARRRWPWSQVVIVKDDSND
jgi:nucleoside-triphosphatase THEP1